MQHDQVFGVFFPDKHVEFSSQKPIWVIWSASWLLYQLSKPPRKHSGKNSVETQCRSAKLCSLLFLKFPGNLLASYFWIWGNGMALELVLCKEIMGFPYFNWQIYMFLLVHDDLWADREKCIFTNSDFIYFNLEIKEAKG
jgi:hypothetical protein